MTDCPDCERYKESAKNWRHKAYELSGHPLPWERGDTWQGLTDEEILEEYRQSYGDDGNLTDVYFARAIESKLKEKNHGNG